MRRKRLRSLSRQEPPLSKACAMVIRHALILANPDRGVRRPVSFRDGTSNPLQSEQRRYREEEVLAGKMPGYPSYRGLADWPTCAFTMGRVRCDD